MISHDKDERRGFLFRGVRNGLMTGGDFLIVLARASMSYV
jgi:hypothetical protein